MINSYFPLYWLAWGVNEPTHFSQRVANMSPGVVLWPGYYLYQPHLTSLKLGQQGQLSLINKLILKKNWKTFAAICANSLSFGIKLCSGIKTEIDPISIEQLKQAFNIFLFQVWSDQKY